MRALGITETDVVGLSLGGRIAVDVMLAHPDLVDASVLVAPGLSGFSFQRRSERRAELARGAGGRLGHGDALLVEQRLHGAGDAEPPHLARIPGAREIVVPNAGHIVSMEQPDQFNRALLDFLAAPHRPSA